MRWYWRKIARHERGFILSVRSGGQKAPFIYLKLTHPAWKYNRYEHDQAVWLCWITEHQLLSCIPRNSITKRFETDLPDVYDWVVEVMQRPAKVVIRRSVNVSARGKLKLVPRDLGMGEGTIPAKSARVKRVSSRREPTHGRIS
jgi:hypothetical protein